MDFRNEFTRWLSERFQNIKVDLKVKPSTRVPDGINSCCIGIEEVLLQYKWRADWSHDNCIVKSLDWRSTKDSLSSLSRWIKCAVLSEDSTEEDARTACLEIIKWGGNRRKDRGAVPFIETKFMARGLCEYFARAKVELCLNDSSDYRHVEEINSMMTKIYSLLSDDGLPIYDGRVAVAAGALIELFCLESGSPPIPEQLQFLGVDRDPRRRVQSLVPHSCLPCNRMNKFKWVSSSVELGRVIRDALISNDMIFLEEGGLPDRMHAVEAALFMIGYDIRSIEGNFRSSVR